MLSTVFNNQQRSGYEELLSYGPQFYKHLYEMDVNYRFAGQTLDLMAEKLEVLMNDQFIAHADEPTITRLEKWLGISTDRTKDLEDRRKKVKLLWNGGDKFSGSLIKSIVKDCTGCDETPSVKMTNHLTITAQIKEDNIVYIADLQELIERMKPAHIFVEVLLVTTTKIKVRNVLRHWVYNHEICGVNPDIATLGALLKTDLDISTNESNIVYPHNQADENSEVGTYHHIATKGAYFGEDINVSAIVTDSVYGHNMASEEAVTGTYPSVTTIGQLNKSDISIEVSDRTTAFSFIECGINSCGEEVL